MNNYFINSFSLFGPEKCSYIYMLPILVRMHYCLYPDENWKFVLYYDNGLDTFKYGKILEQMNQEKIISLRKVENRPFLRCQSMLWRMMPIWDTDSYAVFCRDLDSILTPRQARCVYNFLNTDKIAHGINDNPMHNIPFMGGMVGFKCRDFLRITGWTKFDDMINSCPFTDVEWSKTHGTDQQLLMMSIWPKLKDISLIDDVYKKQCYTDIKIPFINNEVTKYGDEFTEYIGACSLKNGINKSEVRDFYRKYGNNKMNEKIDKIEKENGFIYE